MLKTFMAASAMTLAVSAPAFAQMNDFRTEAMQANAFEVQSAQIALQKSRNPRIRSYAQEALRDHRPRTLPSRVARTAARWPMAVRSVA